MEPIYNREIMLTLKCRHVNVTKINSKFINDNYKNILAELLFYTVKQIDVICQHLQQRPLCLPKQNNHSTYFFWCKRGSTYLIRFLLSKLIFFLLAHTLTPSMIDKTKPQQYQLFIIDFYFYFIRCKRGLTSFDFCSKMDNCGCVHLKPNRSGTAWRRTRCLRKTERLASNGSQNSWVINLLCLLLQ